jgi:hypothetical protein
MNTYVAIYTGLPNPSEDRAAVTAAWKQWFNSLGAAVVDPGYIFTKATTINMDATTQAGSALRLTGCSILQAETLNAAIDMVKRCPGLHNADIAVYETVKFG